MKWWKKAVEVMPRFVPKVPTTHEEIVRRGQAAQELLNNPLLNESVATLENDLLSQMRVVSLADVDSHTRLVLALQVTGAVTKHLRNLIEEGAVAAGEIDLRGQRID